MDLSKLPKFSHTPSPPPESVAPASGEPCSSSVGAPLERPGIGVGGEIWISLVIGVLLLLIGRSFGGYLWSTLTGQTHHTGIIWSSGPQAGEEVAYFDVVGMSGLSDSAIFLFGLAMVFEAVSLAVAFSRLRGKTLALGLALTVAFLATAYNLFVAVRLLGVNIIPILSGLAVAFGGYMVVYQWKLLLVLRNGQAAPMT
jgi:hypothetical protein